MIPLSGLKHAIDEFRATARQAGRDPHAVEVKAPGTIHITSDIKRAHDVHAGTLAFYAARMGSFYAEQLTRYGFGEEVNRIKEAWNTGGAKTATGAVTPRLVNEMGYIGDVNGAVERLKAQEEAGVDLHPVEVDARDAGEFARTIATLIG
ncbi:MAG: LLM class flavin-dependent oxidoreductase, partial [Candidatus Binataceae bacterium]